VAQQQTIILNQLPAADANLQHSIASVLPISIQPSLQPIVSSTPSDYPFANYSVPQPAISVQSIASHCNASTPQAYLQCSAAFAAAATASVPISCTPAILQHGQYDLSPTNSPLGLQHGEFSSLYTTSCTHSRNGIRLRVLQTSFRATPCGAHSAPPAPLRALSGGGVGHLEGRDLHAASLSVTLVAPIQVLQGAPHDARLGLAFNIVTYLLHGSGASERGGARSNPWTRPMHAVVARGDENVVCFKRMSLRLRGGTKPIRNTSREPRHTAPARPRSPLRCLVRSLLPADHARPAALSRCLPCRRHSTFNALCACSCAPPCGLLSHTQRCMAPVVR